MISGTFRAEALTHVTIVVLTFPQIPTVICSHSSKYPKESVSRFLDLFVAAIGLIVLLPLALVVAAVVKFSEGGPVLFKALRVGKGGKVFNIYKFRTMIPNANREGGGITTAQDSRVTTMGRFLRHWKIDELPQLINVIKGEMSLVGPRPEDPRYVAGYNDQQRSLLSIRPGITSPASLAYRNEAELLSGEDWERRYLKEILPHKLALELEYQRTRSLRSDLSLIVRTLGGILK
jgi:lipopolysaccharide/colanic/teichoic acid biosynthesis glycosyltransferase